MRYSLSALTLAATASAGTLLWDGRAPTAADLSAWSWSNAVGVYQYYIHGTSALASYVNLDTTYKNPADTGSSTGIKITLDSTSYWNGQTMRRTELIPQTSAAINSGKVYYHFSISRSATNAPSEFREHQIAFFESHFTEMKSGWQSGASGTSDAALRWNANAATQWNTTWEADVWHNIAYGIDFSANTVEFYHSTGANDLVLTVPAVSVTASSDGKDFHVGVLELPRDGYADETEDIMFSGVYIESEDITLSVSGPGGSSAAAASGSAASAAVPSSIPSSTKVVSVVTASVAVVPVAASSSAPSSTTSPSLPSSIALTSAKPSVVAAPTTLQTIVRSSAAASTTAELAAAEVTPVPIPATTASSSSVPVPTTATSGLSIPSPTTTQASLMAQVEAYIIAILIAMKQIAAKKAASS